MLTTHHDHETDHAHGTDPHQHAHDAAADTVIDPVCGMTVDPHSSAHRFQSDVKRTLWIVRGILRRASIAIRSAVLITRLDGVLHTKFRVYGAVN